MVGWIIGGIAALIVLWFIVSYNGFVKGKNSVSEAFSSMDVFMKKRFDLIPNVVETVKGYAKHEAETLEKAIKARSAATGIGEKAQAESNISGCLKTLFAVAEAYPDLKANTNFMDLQNQLTRIETEIASSRRFYNACVKEFNIRVDSFPSVIIARLFGFTKYVMFEVDSPEERKNVKVSF